MNFLDFVEFYGDVHWWLTHLHRRRGMYCYGITLVYLFFIKSSCRKALELDASETPFQELIDRCIAQEYESRKTLLISNWDCFWKTHSYLCFLQTIDYFLFIGCTNEVAFGRRYYTWIAGKSETSICATRLSTIRKTLRFSASKTTIYIYMFIIQS